MDFSFIRYLSTRYAFSKAAHHRGSVMRIIITAMLSLSVSILAIAIMDYMQGKRFDAIRDVRSFDIVVDGRHREELSALYPHSSVFEYGEGEALIGGRAYLVRYIDRSYDGGIGIIAGNSDSLMLPFSSIGGGEGILDVTVLRKGKGKLVLPRTLELRLSGIYGTSLGEEFDSLYAFLPISLADETVSFKTAIKGIPAGESRRLSELGHDAVSWKEQESSLYSAFIVEKAMMYAVLLLLFIVIAVSTRQSVRIFYRAKQRERAELLVLGASGPAVQTAFALSFMTVLSIALALAIVSGNAMLLLAEGMGKWKGFAMNLEFPVGAFASFSLFLVAMTAIFIAHEGRKEYKRDIAEVLHG